MFYVSLCVTFVQSIFAIIPMGKRDLVDLLRLSSWYLVIIVWLILTMPRVRLQLVIVVFPDYTHLKVLHVLSLKTQKTVFSHKLFVNVQFNYAILKTMDCTLKYFQASCV